MRKSKLLTVLVAAAIGVSMVGCGSSGGSSSSGSGGSKFILHNYRRMERK